MKDKVLRWCRENGLLSPGQTVVCAVSGGADSVAMLHLLLSLRPRLGLTVHAAHFNHCLRGEESDRDEAFVRTLCGSWDVPLTVSSGDVAARAQETGESLEEAARSLRYAFFASLGQTVATAHTADDNLETVLLNLLRGTGLTGLSGIPPKRAFLIRPLLCLTRADILSYLDEHRLPHVEDSSNAADACVRNRLRHGVIPLLKAENPQLPETVLRETGLLRQDDAFLTAQAGLALRSAADSRGGWQRAPLCALPDAVRTRAVRAMLQSISVSKLSRAHITAVDRLLFSGSPSARVSLPDGWEAQRDYDRLVLVRAARAQTFQPVRLIPGAAVLLPELGLRVHCEWTKNFTKNVERAFTFACRCDMIEAERSLFLRPRQSGDRIRLPGGSRSLKRLLCDRKIPAAQRGLIPVLASGAQVLAVYGVGIHLDRMPVEGQPAVIIQIEKEEYAV